MNSIKNNSIIFSNNQDKYEILNYLKKESLFLNLKFFHTQSTFVTVNKSYYFYLYKTYGIQVDLAKRLVKYFIYLEDKVYQHEKLNQLVTIKKDLLEKEMISLENIHLLNKKTIYTINNHPVPKMIQQTENIELTTLSNKPIHLVKTINLEETVYYALEKVIDLLENNLSINDIVILNSNQETTLLIEKLFYDAHIPVNLNESTKLNKIPDVIKLIRILKEDGFNASKTYLNELIQSKSNRKYVRKLINLYNHYLDEDLSKHPDILINILNNESISPDNYQNCINLYQLDEFNYDPNKHYIVLNYTDHSIPLTSSQLHYLNDYELAELFYMSEIDIQVYLSKQTIHLLNKIDHLYLVYPEIEEFNLPNLSLAREVVTENYQYTLKQKTYLNSLNQLNFAKDKYDFETYYLKNKNLESLYKNFNSRIIKYNHQFTGIRTDSLNDLLKKNNSITPYKLENYELCRFKYLLDNLLKLANYETTLSQFLGTLSHKVLEEYTLDKSVDIGKLIDEFKGFPEEISYKENIFKQAIKQEMEHLLPEIDSLHDTTEFNQIQTEYQFKMPFKNDPDFLISGIIDKVMIKNLENGQRVFVLIDYKLGHKDFDMDKYSKKIQLQLPMYLYAFKTSDNLIPLGFFYQTTTLGRYKLAPKAIPKNFALKGIVLEDKELLTKFNPDLEVLQGITLTSKGLRKSKRLLTEKNLLEMQVNIENIISEMVSNLKLGKFDINPIPSYGSKPSVSCEYCQHASICYNKLGG